MRHNLFQPNGIAAFGRNDRMSMFLTLSPLSGERDKDQLILKDI